MNGALARQQRGAWSTTTANLWGVLALERFAAVMESVPVAGRSVLQLGATTSTLDWRGAPAGGAAGRAGGGAPPRPPPPPPPPARAGGGRVARHPARARPPPAPPPARPPPPPLPAPARRPPPTGARGPP